MLSEGLKIRANFQSCKYFGQNFPMPYKTHLKNNEKRTANVKQMVSFPFSVQIFIYLDVCL